MRRWLAKKLHYLSGALHPSVWSEVIVITTPEGKELTINVIADAYVCGVSFTSGIPWSIGESSLECEVSGWTFEWRDGE